MWDKHHWRAARRAFRDQRRAARRAFKNARHGYRHSYYRRSPFFGILLFMLIFFVLWHSWHFLIPLAILVGFAYIVLRLLRSSSLSSGNTGFSGSNSNYQQPNQYYQPPQQPNQYYQPPASSQPNTPSTPPYQPYEQGYQIPHNSHQQGAQPYRSPQYLPDQYEEPQAQYPQEMPPMV